VHHQSFPSVKTVYQERRRAGEFGARVVKSKSGYRALQVFLIRDGTTSRLLPRTFAIFLIVHYRAAASRPARQYEFPTGYNTYFGPERYQVGEQFFFHSPQLVVRVSILNRFEKPFILCRRKIQTFQRTSLPCFQSLFALVIRICGKFSWEMWFSLAEAACFLVSLIAWRQSYQGISPT
jgi:hypothetical protein